MVRKNELSPEVYSTIQVAAAYIRVSTDDQLEYSPESQLAEIQKYCAEHNLLLSSEHIYIEQEGRSGRKSKNREAFQRMIADAKQKPKPFDVIILWKFSRFARNQDESTFYKSMLRKKLGIEVVSVSEPLMEGMYGRLIEMIIEWQDEFYSYNLGIEVSRSMSLRAKKGLYNGKMPIGYSKAPDAFPVIVESEAHIVRTIFHMFTTGYDKNYIVRHLNDMGFKTKTGKKWDADGVTYVLSNPFYIGKIRWNRRKSSSSSELKEKDEWIVSDSHHEPLIDLDTWNAAQERASQIRKVHEQYSHPVSHTKHWLSGIVKCPICGKSLSYKHHYDSILKDGRFVKGYNTFQCLGYRQGIHSESQSISERKLTAAVLESLRSVLTTPADISFELVRTTHTDEDLSRQIYQNELDSLIRKADRVREAYLNEIDTLEDYKRNREIIERRREELNELIAGLDTRPLNPADYKEQFLGQVKSVLDIIESDAPYELKGEALRSIVKKIVFYKATHTLEFHYYLITE